MLQRSVFVLVWLVIAFFVSITTHSVETTEQKSNARISELERRLHVNTQIILGTNIRIGRASARYPLCVTVISVTVVPHHREYRILARIIMSLRARG
jgi:hypothetical protein